MTDMTNFVKISQIIYENRSEVISLHLPGTVDEI